ncbi:PecA family PE domain-processing aspartic protease [Mycobacterium marinum]|uniref:PecA family PE domain-processing aspartic protease n=1 Tax=Mycobacterium marinum TaxID=1781 RepID=UPI00356612A5
MSSMAVFPEAVSAAAADVANIGQALSAANAAATVPTTNLLAAGTDEISTAVASLFSGHGQAYQRLANQLMAFHEQFAQALTAGASAYTGAEATNASPLQTVEQNALGLINAPTQTLLGRPLIGDGAAGTATNPNGGAGGLGISGDLGTGGAGGTGGFLLGDYGVSGAGGDGRTVPLEVVNVTEPVVNVNVNGGHSTPVLIDTGSAGLVMQVKDVGGPLGLLRMGLPSGISMSAYSGGLTYLFATYPTTVDFGNGIVTSTTGVDVVLFSIPTSPYALTTWLNALWSNPLTTPFDAYFQSAGVDGVLGVGPNAVGPGPSIPTQALGGGLGQGLLIDMQGGELVFGPNPLTPEFSVSGAPISTLWVSVDGGPLIAVPSIIDSGGVMGTIPSSVIGGSTLPANTNIVVYTDSAMTNEVYSYNTNNYQPTVISSGLMNTGFLPFWMRPVYIDYSPAGTGTTVFNNP